MISRKFSKDSQLQTIIGIRTQNINENKQNKTDTIYAVTSRTVSSSPYAAIGAMDPRISMNNNERNVSKNIEHDFFSTKKIQFKQQLFDDSNFNADKPLPSKEIIIEPEKPVVNSSRIHVSAEFNNL